MEKVGQILGGANFAVLKEPRGILKPIQWVLSIFAFATMTGVTLSLGFSAKCVDGNTTEPVVHFNMKSSYPYDLKEVGPNSKVCDEDAQNLIQGSSGAAQFYVFVGVMVFLYCLAALVLYILFDEAYRKYNQCTYADFIISGVIVLLWLIGSSAWAQGVSDLKYYTDLGDCGYLEKLPGCKSPSSCGQTSSPNFASMNVSILFGFLNMCVWAGNMWFLFKETPWHKVNQSKPPTMPGGPSMEGDPQRI